MNLNIYKLALTASIWMSLNSYSHANLCSNFDSFSFKNHYPSSDVLIEADESKVDGKQIFELIGNVSLLNNKYSLNAEKVFLNSKNKTITASDNIFFKSDKLNLSADSLNYTEEKLVADNASFSFANTNASGTAKKIVITDSIHSLFSSNFTTCPTRKRDWYISSEKIKIDENENSGYADEAVLNFYGIPILYIPQLSWTLKGRGSGLLAPSFTSYTDVAKESKGQKLNVPYYFNLQKDKDFLLELDYMSTRGLLFGGTYRQLIYPLNEVYDSGDFQLSFKYLDQDKVSNLSRWYSKNNLNLNLNQNTSLKIQTHRVSDENFSKEINFENGEKNLISFLRLNHTSDDLLAEFDYENEQVLNGGTSTYTRSPSIRMTKKLPLDAINLSLELNSTDFKNKDNNKINGMRSYASILLEKDLIIKNFDITPRLGFNHTNYNLSNNTSINRSLANFSINAETDLEVKNISNKNNFGLILSPKVTYNFTEKKNQSSNPLFDTEKITIDSYNSFMSKRFTGLDRINNDNSLTYGLSSSLIDGDNGSNSLNFNLSQSYRLDRDVMNIDGAFNRDKAFSDVYIDSSLIKKDNSLDISLNYDPYSSKTKSSLVSYTSHKGPKNILGIGYLSDQGRYANVYGSLPITSSLSVFGSINKNLSNSIDEKKLFGLAYENCCWELKLARFDGVSNEDSLNFELVFKDLASSSPNLTERIKSLIPRYLETNEF